MCCAGMKQGSCALTHLVISWSSPVLEPIVDSNSQDPPPEPTLAQLLQSIQDLTTSMNDKFDSLNKTTWRTRRRSLTMMMMLGLSRITPRRSRVQVLPLPLSLIHLIPVMPTFMTLTWTIRSPARVLIHPLTPIFLQRRRRRRSLRMMYTLSAYTFSL